MNAKVTPTPIPILTPVSKLGDDLSEIAVVGTANMEEAKVKLAVEGVVAGSLKL